MKKIMFSVLMFGTLAAPMAITAPAVAQPAPDYRWYGDRSDWDAAQAYRDDRRYWRHQRRLAREDRVYYGRDQRYYCRRSDGTTGLVVGGVGGAVAGGAIGGDTLGALVGAGAGALLGRAIDRGDVRCR